MNLAEAEKLLNEVPLLTNLTPSQFADVEQCLQSRGFAAIAGLMLGTKQTFLTALANLSLGTAEKSCAAAVLQGQIKGIDQIRQEVLSLYQDADFKSQSATSQEPIQ